MLIGSDAMDTVMDGTTMGLASIKDMLAASRTIK